MVATLSDLTGTAPFVPSRDSSYAAALSCRRVAPAKFAVSIPSLPSPDTNGRQAAPPRHVAPLETRQSSLAEARARRRPGISDDRCVIRFACPEKFSADKKTAGWTPPVAKPFGQSESATQIAMKVWSDLVSRRDHEIEVAALQNKNKVQYIPVPIGKNEALIKLRAISDGIERCSALSHKAVFYIDALDDEISKLSAPPHAVRVPAALEGSLASSIVVPPIPKTFEEAQARVPGLMKWIDARRQGISFTDHLRNCETGLGRWTLSEAGLPRNLLRKIDPRAYE